MPEAPASSVGKLDLARLFLIALLFSFSFISYFDRTIMSIAGPQLMKDFSLSAMQMGSIYSAFILGYAVFMIPCGQLTDRLGGRLVLALMGILSAAFTALIVLGGRPGLGALVGVMPALFSIRLGLGVVTAPLYPACARIAANWIPVTYHARVQGLVIAGSSLGAAVSPLLFTWMLVQFQWRLSFAIAALVTGSLAALWFWHARDYPADTRPPERKTPPISWAQLFTNRNLMLVTFAYGALGYFQYIFFYWIYYYFGEVLHLGAQSSARYTTILFLTECAIMPLGGVISDRLTRIYGAQFGRRVVPMAGLALSAVFTYAGTVSPGIGGVVTCLSLAVGLAACCEGPFWAAVTEMAGEHVGGASSILNTGAQIGGMFAPVLTPYVASRAGWSWGLYTGGLIAISGVVAVYFADVRPREVSRAPAAGSQPAAESA